MQKESTLISCYEEKNKYETKALKAGMIFSTSRKVALGVKTEGKGNSQVSTFDIYVYNNTHITSNTVTGQTKLL